MSQDVEYTVERVLYHLDSSYLIKWKSWSTAECTWEPQENFASTAQKKFQEFQEKLLERQEEHCAESFINIMSKSQTQRYKSLKVKKVMKERRINEDKNQDVMMDIAHVPKSKRKVKRRHNGLDEGKIKGYEYQVSFVGCKAALWEPGTTLIQIQGGTNALKKFFEARDNPQEPKEKKVKKSKTVSKKAANGMAFMDAMKLEVEERSAAMQETEAREKGEAEKRTTRVKRKRTSTANADADEKPDAKKKKVDEEEPAAVPAESATVTTTTNTTTTTITTSTTGVLPPPPPPADHSDEDDSDDEIEILDSESSDNDFPDSDDDPFMKDLSKPTHKRGRSRKKITKGKSTKGKTKKRRANSESHIRRHLDAHPDESRYAKKVNPNVCICRNEVEVGVKVVGLVSSEEEGEELQVLFSKGNETFAAPRTVFSIKYPQVYLDYLFLKAEEADKKEKEEMVDKKDRVKNQSTSGITTTADDDPPLHKRRKRKNEREGNLVNGPRIWTSGDAHK